MKKLNGEQKEAFLKEIWQKWLFYFSPRSRPSDGIREVWFEELAGFSIEALSGMYTEAKHIMLLFPSVAQAVAMAAEQEARLNERRMLAQQREEAADAETFFEKKDSGKSPKVGALCRAMAAGFTGEITLSRYISELELSFPLEARKLQAWYIKRGDVNQDRRGRFAAMNRRAAE